MKQRQQEGMKEGRGKRNEGSDQNGIVARGPSVSRSFLHVSVVVTVHTGYSAIGYSAQSDIVTTLTHM